MPVEVRGTVLADKQIDALRGRARQTYDTFEGNLARRGCAALDYRLSGEGLEYLCVTHLARSLRVIVAFEAPEIAYVLLVGVHDESDPALDVYRQLYELAGHTPSDQTRRTKPPCCDHDTGEPQVNPMALDELRARMRRVRARDVRRVTDHTRSGGRRSRARRHGR